MNPSMAFARKTALAYGALCRPLCQELGLSQTAFDILLFLANNPDCRTARDIVEVRRIKANLVSVHVDRLVRARRPAEDGAGLHGPGPARGGAGPGAANRILRPALLRHR